MAGTQGREAMGSNVEQGVIARIASGVRYMITGVGPENFFGPMQPLAPLAQEKTEGRQFDYPVGYNIRIQPRSEENISFWQLRGLADGYDLLRLIIETRKDQIEAFEWELVPKDKEADADALKGEILAATTFLEKPDRENDWSEWVRKLTEEVLVTDAACVYPRLNRGGKLYGLELVDGATIKRLLDDGGRTPLPPSPAYQQVLKGIPTADYTREQLIYMARNQRVWKIYGYSPVEQIIMTVNIALRRQVSQLQHYCYSDDTEVLTKNGWKYFSDCAVDEEFATRQIGTGIFEWQTAYDTFRAHYTGDMIQFKGKSLDLLVTPNHRMLVNSLPSGVANPEMSCNGEHVISAEQMLEHGTRNTGIPKTSVWQGTEVEAQLFTDSLQKTNTARAVSISGDDYCALMGMYLAEGNLNAVGGIIISQPIDKRGAHELYKELLERIFGSVTFYGHQFEVCSKAVAQHLQQFGKSWQKFIPEQVRSATPRQLAIFFRYYYLGDGAASGDGATKTKVAFTVSRRLADHLTEIGQKMGYAPSVWTRNAGKAFFGEREINAREGYMVSFARMAATKGWVAEYVAYDGPIACVCVPNKFLYVRRNGKACWSGNTEGNIPEAIAQLPKDWTPQVVKEFQGWWDSLMEGNTAQQRKMKFIPNIEGILFPKEGILKDEYDEWLARICCFAFSIAPTAFVKQQNRATAEQAADTAKEEGLAPLLRWLATKMTSMLQGPMGYPQLVFRWKMSNKVDPKVQAEVDNIYVAMKAITPDEVRESLGKDALTPEQKEAAWPAPPPPPEAPVGKTDPLTGLPYKEPVAPKHAEKLEKADDRFHIEVHPPAVHMGDTFIRVMPAEAPLVVEKSNG